MAKSKDSSDKGAVPTGMIEADGGVFYAPPTHAEEKHTPGSKPPAGDRRQDDRRAIDAMEFKGIERRKADRRGGVNLGRRSSDTDGGGEEYRLKSKAESAYPQAYKPVSAEFWEGLTKEQQDQLVKIQAIAQEKVGYEKGTTKYFIDDPHPGPVGEGSAEKGDPVSDAAPRLVTGGILIGAGGLALALALASVLPMGPVLVSSIIALLTGIFLTMGTRS